MTLTARLIALNALWLCWLAFDLLVAASFASNSQSLPGFPSFRDAPFGVDWLAIDLFSYVGPIIINIADAFASNNPLADKFPHWPGDHLAGISVLRTGFIAIGKRGPIATGKCDVWMIRGRRRTGPRAHGRRHLSHRWHTRPRTGIVWRAGW